MLEPISSNQNMTQGKHSSEEAVVVFSNILQSNPTKLRLHLLLTVCDLDTELNTLKVHCFREAFEKLQLLLNLN